MGDRGKKNALTAASRWPRGGNSLWKMCLWGYGKGFLQGALLGLLFYRHPLGIMALGMSGGLLGVWGERRERWQGMQQEITWQFREGMQGIASSLGAGYSIENAFGESRKDLILLYGENSVLEQEFLGIERQLALNRPVEKVLFDFAEKWDVEDIRHFAQVFQTAQRTGGNLIAITRATAEKISQKMEVQREIQTMIAGRKLEGKVISVIPLGLMLFFWISSPGFLDCFYVSSGRAVATVLLAVYLGAYRWCRTICDIRV